MNQLTAIDLVTMIQTNLLNNDIDATVTLQGNGVTLELEDMTTSKTIGVIKGETLEDAYSKLLSKFAIHVRDIKVGKFEGLSRL